MSCLVFGLAALIFDEALYRLLKNVYIYLIFAQFALSKVNISYHPLGLDVICVSFYE